MDEKQTPDDVLLYITQFIKPIDCMAFAVARVSRRFNAFFLRRQRYYNYFNVNSTDVHDLYTLYLANGI